MKNKILTIGADPEMFIQNDVEIVSAEGYVKGTKDKPYEIKKGFGLQLDNVACEFNIPPATTFEEFKTNIDFSLNFIEDMLKRENLTISRESSHNFAKKYLQTENAKLFGCDPDFDVWEQGPNEVPESVGDFRTVAGHIHIGYNGLEEVSMETSEKIVKAFDLFVVLPSILTDPDRARRKLYGKAGAFRFKEYGVECRALSNFWLFDEGKMEMVWNATQLAVKVALSSDMNAIWDDHGADIIKAINNYDENIAKRLITDVVTPFYEEIEEFAAVKK